MPRRKPARHELDLLQEASAKPLALALAAVERARLRGDIRAMLAAQDTLARRLANTQAAADLMGRRRMLIDAERASHCRPGGQAPQAGPRLG